MAWSCSSATTAAACKPHASEPSEIGGIGIPVMLALADSVEFAGADGEGTDVRMRFSTPKAAQLAGEASSQEAAEEVLIGADGDQDGVYLAVGPPALASAVLARVLAAVAARAHLSTERIATTRPLAEQLVDHLSKSDEIWHLALAATVAPRQLDLRVVSLPAGSSLGELPPALEELTECHRVSRKGSVEVLALRLQRSAAGPRARKKITVCRATMASRAGIPHSHPPFDGGDRGGLTTLLKGATAGGCRLIPLLTSPKHIMSLLSQVSGARVDFPRGMGAIEQLRIDVRREPDRVVIALEGELDMASAPAAAEGDRGRRPAGQRHGRARPPRPAVHRLHRAAGDPRGPQAVHRAQPGAGRDAQLPAGGAAADA